MVLVTHVAIPNPSPGKNNSQEGLTAIQPLPLVVDEKVTTAEKSLTIHTPGQFRK
jgi:hypothetical protein